MRRRSLFNRLFSPSKKALSHTFNDAQKIGSMPGIKILRSDFSEDQSEGRLLVVPTRAFKGHVQRNKVRRQIKALLYEHQLLIGLPGTYLIFLYDDAQRIPFHELSTFLIKVFTRLLKKSS